MAQVRIMIGGCKGNAEIKTAMSSLKRNKTILAMR